MHILAMLIGVVGVAAVWYWRIRMMKGAADDVADAAGRAIGKYKRYKFRKKAEAAPVEAVDDPVAAAAVMMIAVASAEQPLSTAAEDTIRREITGKLGGEPTDLMVFAKWVASHVEDPNNVSLRYAKLWAKALNMDERRELVDMVRRVAAADGEPSPRQLNAIARLSERLGL